MYYNRSGEGDLIAWNHWSHAIDGHLTAPPLSLCALSLSLCRGISGTSLHLWSEGEGTPKASCWVRDVTCGTELHAVWPRSGHSSRSGGSAARPKSNYSDLPKVTGLGGKTMCSGVASVGGRGLVCWVSFFFGFIIIMVLLLYSYCMISSERQRLWHISLALRKAAVSFLQSVYHDISTIKTFSLQTFCHLYNISFLLLKYVRVFLMEYILKCLEKRFTFLNICKILTLCFVFLFVFYFILLWKKKSFNHFASSFFFFCNWGKKDKWRKKKIY